MQPISHGRSFGAGHMARPGQPAIDIALFAAVSCHTVSCRTRVASLRVIRRPVHQPSAARTRSSSTPAVQFRMTRRQKGGRETGFGTCQFSLSHADSATRTGQRSGGIQAASSVVERFPWLNRRLPTCVGMIGRILRKNHARCRRGCSARCRGSRGKIAADSAASSRYWLTQ